MDCLWYQQCIYAHNVSLYCFYKVPGICGRKRVITRSILIKMTLAHKLMHILIFLKWKVMLLVWKCRTEIFDVFVNHTYLRSDIIFANIQYYILPIGHIIYHRPSSWKRRKHRFKTNLCEILRRITLPFPTLIWFILKLMPVIGKIICN